MAFGAELGGGKHELIQREGLKKRRREGLAFGGRFELGSGGGDVVAVAVGEDVMSGENGRRLVVQWRMRRRRN